MRESIYIKNLKKYLQLQKISNKNKIQKSTRSNSLKKFIPSVCLARKMIPAKRQNLHKNKIEIFQNTSLKKCMECTQIL